MDKKTQGILNHNGYIIDVNNVKWLPRKNV